MGQYLAVGLRLKASVRKEKQLDGKSVEEILGKVGNYSANMYR